MNNPIPDAVIAILRRPLPPEAIKPHPTKSYLSSIKAIYCVERLNEAFGLNGWKIRNEIVEIADFKRMIKGNETTGTMIVMKSFLTVPEYGIEIEAYGGNDNEDRGDAYKGACTDALTKACSYIYIGMDVYKGLGSKAEAQAVADKKIAAMRGGASYESVSTRDERRDPPESVIGNTGPYIPPKPEIVPPPDPKPPFNMGKSINEFQKLHAFACDSLGKKTGDEIYYKILGRFGAEHSNELKSAKPARECYRTMAAEIDSAISYKKGSDAFDAHLETGA